MTKTQGRKRSVTFWHDRAQSIKEKRGGKRTYRGSIEELMADDRISIYAKEYREQLAKDKEYDEKE